MAAGTIVKVLDRPDPNALGVMVSAELTKQIETAKKYPRDEKASLETLQDIACRSDAVAESCMYTLKRRDKDGSQVFITGPSVRFAELLCYVWGNMRAGARIIDEGDRAVVAQGVAYDLQRNNGLMLEVRRNIVTSSGARFGNDMISVTSNAACSIALRNVIFDCIPQVLWWDVYEVVKQKAVGAAQIPERIQKAVKFFVAKGAKQEDILAALGVNAIEDMGREHLEVFIGLQTALKEGGVTADKIFTAEGAEQRRSLSLISEEEEHFGGIDAQLKKNAPAPGAKKKGDQAAAPEVLGDGGVSLKGSDKAETTPAAAAAGSGKAADPKADRRPEESPQPGTEATKGKGKSATESQAGDSAEVSDEQIVAGVEAKIIAGKALSNRKAVNEHRGALNMIAATGEPAIAERAKKLVTDWPAK